MERRLAALQSTPPAGRKTYIIKDVRLFLNSLDRGLRLIREAGVDARSERQETEEDILLTIRIPKQRRGVSDFGNDCCYRIVMLFPHPVC